MPFVDVDDVKPFKDVDEEKQFIDVDDESSALGYVATMPVGVAEVALTGVSGLYSAFIGTIGGVGKAYEVKIEDGKHKLVDKQNRGELYADTFNEIVEAGTYKPRTEFGKDVIEVGAKVGEWLTEVGQDFGDWTFEQTGSPVLATAARLMPEATAMASGYAVSRVIAKGRDVKESLKEKPLTTEERVESSAVAAGTIPPEATTYLKSTPDADMERAAAWLNTDRTTIDPTGKAININLDYIHTLEDVKKSTRLTTDVFKHSKSTKTMDQIAREAESVNMNLPKMEKLHADLRDIEARVTAARTFTATEGLAITEQAAKLRATGGTQAEYAAFAQRLSTYSATLETLEGVSASVGRGLVSHKIVVEADLATQKGVQSVLKTYGNESNIKSIVAHLADVETPDKVNKYLKEVSRSSGVGDVLIEAYINSLLSSPTTHVTNILSTLSYQGYGTLENYTAASLALPKRGVAAIKGKPVNAVTFREANARAVGQVQGLSDGVKAFWKTFRTGDPDDPLSKVELEHHRAFRGSAFGLKKDSIPSKAVDIIGEWGVRLPGKLLMSEDEFMKAIAYRSEINGLAMRQALQERDSGVINSSGVKGRYQDLVQNPPKANVTTARDAARYWTFTKPLGKYGRGVQQATAHPIVKSQIPFVRTPINIIKATGERTPFAFFNPTVRGAIKGGGPQSELQLARITLAAGTSYLFYELAKGGYLTGSGPVDPDEARMKRAAGWQPSAFVDKDGIIGEAGKSYHLGRMDPLSTFTSVMADYAEYNEQMTDKEADEVLAYLAASVSKNLVNKTYMSGISTMMKAVDDPYNNGTYLARWLNSFAASAAVPSVVAWSARLDDPYMYKAESMLDAIKIRAGKRLTEELGGTFDIPRATDPLGKEIKREGALGGPISPIFMTDISKEKIYLEIADMGMGLRMPKKSIEGVELSPQQYRTLMSNVSTITEKTLKPLVNNPAYDKAPTWKKEELIRKYYNESVRRAQDMMKRDLSEGIRDYRVTEALKKAQ